jgi:hypothetical protein
LNQSKCSNSNQNQLEEKNKIKAVKKPLRKTNKMVNMIGKRESYDKEFQQVKILTKKQRRNKHCKQNYEWLLEGSEESKKKKTTVNSSQKPVSTTKFVLKRDTKGLGISFFNNPKKNKNRTSGNGFRNKIFMNSIKRSEEKKNRSKLRKNGNGRMEGKSTAKVNGSNTNTNKSTPSKSKISKTIPKMVWNSRGQCDEKTKLQSKINKVRTYWNRTSLLIPNVFRHVSEMKDEPLLLFEFLDLSRKELLVQANGQKAISQAGAPHLQRKNKGKKTLEKANTNNRNIQQKIKNNEKSERSIKIMKKEQKESVPVKKKIIKKKEVEMDTDFSKLKKKKSNLFMIKLNSEESKDPKEESIITKNKEEESKRLLEENLEKVKKQLREDLNKAHQKIELSFVSEKAENWSKNDLDAFNNNISEYNQLLDEQEKLRYFQIGDEEKTMKDIPISPSSLNFLEKKLNKTGHDDIKKQISMYVKRKGLNRQNISKKDNVTLGKNSRFKLTLQDILQLELEDSITKRNNSSLSKLSKRIHKKKLLPLKKKFSVSLNGTNKGKKSQHSKKNSLPHTNLWGAHSTIKRKASEDQSILENQNDEDLAISINSTSFENLSETSVCSLKEHMTRFKNKKNQIIIRN